MEVFGTELQQHYGTVCPYSNRAVLRAAMAEKRDGRACSTYGGQQVYTGFWRGNLKERDHLEDTGVDGRITLRWIFRKWNVGAWTGLIWPRIGTGGGHL
jgi:hypothetical protein